MNSQLVIVLLFVIGAAWYIGARAARLFNSRRTATGCDSGCNGCSAADVSASNKTLVALSVPTRMSVPTTTTGGETND